MQVRLTGGCCCCWLPSRGGTSRPWRPFPEIKIKGAFIIHFGGNESHKDWLIHSKRDGAIHFSLFPSHCLHFPAHKHSSMLGKPWATHPSFHCYLGQLADLHSPSDSSHFSALCQPASRRDCAMQGLLSVKIKELDWSYLGIVTSASTRRARRWGCLLWLLGKHRRRMSIRKSPGYPIIKPDLQRWVRWQTRANEAKSQLVSPA